MKKNISIFLNNKTITLDTILPFLTELTKKNNSCTYTFYVFNKNTLDVIKSNIFLYELINKLGVLELFSYNNNTKIIINTFNNIFYIIFV